MIRAIQIILLLPLTLVTIPPNVQLLYFFMTFNFNMQLIPLGSFSTHISSSLSSDSFND
jgi:hypothetical protein